MFTKNNLFNRSAVPVRHGELTGGTSAPALSAVNGSQANPQVNLSRETGSNLSAAQPPGMPVTEVLSASATPPQRGHTSIVTKPLPARESLIADKSNGARLHVGCAVKLRGAEILDCDTLVVEGRVEATMDSRVVRIAEGGSFIGKVDIDVAEIHGTFEGELTARSQLIVHSTGRVSGKVRYGKLLVDEGGEICGDISVLAETSAGRVKTVLEPVPVVGVAAG